MSEYNYCMVYGYNCPNKYVIMKSNKPILVVNSKSHASECLSFLEGLITEEELLRTGDRKAIGLLKKVKKVSDGNDNQ